MKRPLFSWLLVVAWVAALAMPLGARAQEGTPSPTPVGEPVTIYGSDAQPIGTVSVDNLTDPFDAFDASSQPARGYRWVMATVTVTAGEQALTPNSSGFLAIDSEGFLSYQSYVSRPSEASAELPDFTSDEIPAGQSRTGAIFFQIFVGSDIAAIEYGNQSDMSVTVYNPSGKRVQAGDTISVAANDGSPMVDVTVNGVIDPLTDYDPSSPPQRGFAYAGVVVTITNTGTRVFQTSPYVFSVTDFEGFVVSSAGIYRTSEGTAKIPDLSYTDLAPGASATGLISFQLINGAKIHSVTFAPTYDRKVRVAEFEQGQAYPEPDLSMLPTAVPADPACADAAAWLQGATSVLDPTNAIFEQVGASDLTAATADPATLRAGAEKLRAAADALKGIDVPEVAQAANAQIVDVLTTVATQIDAMADAAEAKDATAFDSAKAAIEGALSALTSGGALIDLFTRCPDIAG